MQICQILILPDSSHFSRFLGWLDPKIPPGNHQTSGLWNLAFVAALMKWPNTLSMKCSLPGFNIDLQNDSASMGNEVWWAGEHKRQCTKHEALLLLTEDSSAGSLILSPVVNLGCSLGSATPPGFHLTLSSGMFLFPAGFLSLEHCCSLAFKAPCIFHFSLTRDFLTHFTDFLSKLSWKHIIHVLGKDVMFLLHVFKIQKQKLLTSERKASKNNLPPRSKDMVERQIFTAHGRHEVSCRQGALQSWRCMYSQKSWIKSHLKVLYHSQIHAAPSVDKRGADETLVSSELFLTFVFLPLM